MSISVCKMIGLIINGLLFETENITSNRQTIYQLKKQDEPFAINKLI